MMRIPTILISLFFLLLFSHACTHSGNEEKCSAPTPLNPNGDSELALLMREMFEDAMRMKSQIKAGEQPEVLHRFAAIHTAEATEPEKASSTDFQVFAQSYLQTLQAMQNAAPGDANALYHNLVESCMNCHRAMCPGPMVRIKKLYLPKGKKGNS